jgi:hypothetical protein
MDVIFAALESLQNSGLPTALRLSDLAYPLVNAAHILGLALLVGAILALDLRLVGFWSSVPLEPLARLLLPVAICGLLTAIVTGALLFSVHAVKYAGIGAFQFKLLLIGAAVLNALLLHRTSAWKSAIQEPAAPLPIRLRAAALLSILLWSAIILCGRLIAYFA